jgi:hypothetical protein
MHRRSRAGLQGPNLALTNGVASHASHFRPIIQKHSLMSDGLQRKESKSGWSVSPQEIGPSRAAEGWSFLHKCDRHLGLRCCSLNHITLHQPSIFLRIHSQATLCRSSTGPAGSQPRATVFRQRRVRSHSMDCSDQSTTWRSTFPKWLNKSQLFAIADRPQTQICLLDRGMPGEFPV